MNVGSLFSGVGGIELGFERARGFTTKWFVERDDYAQAVLRKHWPDAIIYDDVTQVDFGTVPKVDVLTGGFPCQDISNAGKRVGIEGSRSGLWKEYLRAIRALRPRYVFVENVAALLGRGVDVVLGDLASLGYDAEWHCVSASSVGAPHRRDRIFIIAYLVDSDYDGRFASEERGGVGEGGDCGASESVASGELERSSEQRDVVADSHFGGCVYGQSQEFADCGGEQAQPDCFAKSQAVLSDSCCSGLSGQCQSVGVQPSHAEHCVDGGREVESGLGGVVDGFSDGLHSSREFQTGFWKEEPEGVPRTTNESRNRVDRIKCLGNAVVPAVAEVFARAIKEIEARRRGGV